MNRQRQDKTKEVLDTSNLMLLAEVCCEEIERITHEEKKELEKTGRLRRHFPSHSKNKDHKRAPAIPLPLPNTNKIAKSVTSKPCSSRMAATKGAHDNQQRQQSLPVRNNNNAVVERPSTTPSWVEQLARTQLHCSQPPVWMFEETEMLENGISVMGLDENGRIWDLSLIHWTSINQHLFKREWIDLVGANNFQEGEIIHVWLCRHGNEEQNQGKLCFLIGRLSAQPR
ncbi:hypothetical protein MRB53_035046 [Persea americana]|uniref:Uncharacterized protein n=1 Tax=Persea americana TaxID=3435 RepID=A0ACC2K3T7_PERAE|nr:hypothetical protein MRB53_035046 [Persea americana]